MHDCEVAAAQMVNAQSAHAWGRWPEAQDSANLSHVSVSTPTAPSAQVRQPIYPYLSHPECCKLILKMVIRHAFA